MKKYLLIACAFLALGLTACGDKKDNNGGAPAVATYPNPNSPCVQNGGQGCQGYYGQYQNQGFSNYPYNQYGYYQGYNPYSGSYGNMNGCGYGSLVYGAMYGYGCFNMGNLYGNYYSFNQGYGNTYITCNAQIPCPSGTTCQFPYGGTLGLCRY